MRKWLIGGILIILVGGGVWVWMHYAHSGAAADSEQNLPPYTVPALTNPYTNSTYGFSLKMPADFTVQETQNQDDSGNANGETIVLEDKADNGIQIIISPFDEDTGDGYTLTKDRILQDVPDLQITDEQPLLVGPNYTGLAFKSNNDAFDGDSREVWFVYRGSLYQISTYARLDDLLKAIFGTWQFE